MACRLAGAKPLSEPMLEFLLIGPLETDFCEVLIVIQTFSLKTILLKKSSAKWRPFCLSLIVLKIWHQASSPSSGHKGDMPYYGYENTDYVCI